MSTFLVWNFEFLILAEGDLGPVAIWTTCYFVGGFAMQGVSGVTCLKALRVTWFWVLRLKKAGPCYMLKSLLGDPLFYSLFSSRTHQCSLSNILNLTFLRGISSCSRWNNPSQSVGQADPSSLKPESPHKFLRRDFFDLLKPEPTSQTRPALHPWPSPSPSSSWTLIGACGVETHCIFAVQGNFAACFGMKCLFGHCHFLP